MVASSVAAVAAAVEAEVRDKGRARVALSSRVVRTVARRKSALNLHAAQAMRNRQAKSPVRRVVHAELRQYSKGAGEPDTLRNVTFTLYSVVL